MKVGFIGLGNMAKAIMGGLLKSGIFQAEDIMGSDVADVMRKGAAVQYGIHVTESNKQVAASAEVLVLAVKPQFLGEVLQEIAPYVTKQTLVISIAAGKSLDWLGERLPEETRLIRLMPNTAALVGESCTAVCKGAYATPDDEALAVKMCQAFGKAYIIEEKIMDAYSALAGSSGAFVFLFMEALADGTVAAGVPRKLAYELAAQTVLGAAKLMQETGEHPGVLKDMVCSPGGTTIEGIRALELGGVRGSVMEAIEACVAKSRKL